MDTKGAGVRGGGSALKRLKSDLKSAGVLGGPKAKRRKTNNNNDAAGNKLRAFERKEKLTKLKGENPFELKFAKQKHDVLGKKTSAVSGRPGAMKIKAEEKRIKSLLPELKKGKHESQFVDRRFGENNPKLSLEDKMMERFVREKQKTLRKGDNLFNIDDDEDNDKFGGLTHLGRSLDYEAMKHERLGDDSDMEDDDIDGDVVGAAHFGGFEEGEEGDRSNKSRNEIMKEVIAKSKYYKMLRQQAKDENEDLRMELDAEVDDVRALLTAMEEPKKPATGLPPKPSRPAAPTEDATGSKSAGDYDVIVHQLANEKRAKPQDRLKSEEELVIERREKLERLEQDRQRRLLGLLPEDEAMMGRKRARMDTSGDYLEPSAAFDGMADFDGDMAEAPRPLTYKNGKLVEGDIFMRKARPGKDIASMRGEGGAEEDFEDEEGDEEDGSGDEEEEDSDEDGDEGSEGEEDEESEDGEESESGEEDSDEEDGASDLEDDADVLAGDGESDQGGSEPETEEERQRKEELREARRLAAMKELPYVFPAPESYEDFEELVRGRSASDLDTLISRLRSLYHIKLHANNREKMMTAFGVLMDHLAICYASTPVDAESGEVVARHLKQLSQEMNEAAFVNAREYLEELNERLEESLLRAKTKSVLDTADLARLQLIAQMFPTSDFRHPVTTPLQMIVYRYLDLKLLRNTRDMSVGLALCNMAVQFQNLSKRFVPEVSSFLQNLLACLCASRATEKASITSVGKIKLGMAPKSSPLSLAVPAATITSRLAELYKELPALPEIFGPHIASIADLAAHSKGAAKERLSEALKGIRALVDTRLSERKPLQLQYHKPVAISSYLPKFEENFNASKRYDPNRERQQAKKLQAQYKKEFKGAMREMRKDTNFINRQRIQDIKSKDAAYWKKMARIEGAIGREAGELNQAERLAKKGK